eukprot:3479194-Rhodomonas_salina.2
MNLGRMFQWISVAFFLKVPVFTAADCPTTVLHATKSMSTPGLGGRQVHPRGGYRLRARRAVACRGQAVGTAHCLYAYYTVPLAYRKFRRATRVLRVGMRTKAVWRDSSVIEISKRT